MDASTFEFDEPLPRVCRHCKWADTSLLHDIGGLKCTNKLSPESQKPQYRFMPPDRTCDHWEERE